MFIVTNCFGVELEVGNTCSKEEIANLINDFYDFTMWERRPVIVTDYQQTYSNNYWNVKYDSTCGILGKPRDHGWEIASFIGRNYSDLEHISLVSEHLRKYGLQVNKNCGLHIHWDASNITPEEVGLILAYWIKCEKILYSMVPETRIKSIHCKPVRTNLCLQKAYSPLSLWEVLKPTDFSNFENSQRRYSLNLVNYTHALEHPSYRRRTLEFRLPEGTLSKVNIMNWLYLLQTIFNKARFSTMPDNIRSFRLENFLEFIGFNKNYLLNYEREDTPVMQLFNYEFFLWILARILRHSRIESLTQSAEKYIKYDKIFCN